MKEVIVRLTSDRIKIKGGEYVQDIVRCKECAKRMREDCPMCNGCKLDRVPTEDDDYCSYGEVRDE